MSATTNQKACPDNHWIAFGGRRTYAERRRADVTSSTNKTTSSTTDMQNTLSSIEAKPRSQEFQKLYITTVIDLSTSRRNKKKGLM